MKVLLLTVVLGLLYASQGKAQLLLIPLSGEWRTQYISASNKDKITEGGPFHIYVRHIQFHVNNTADVDFYVKSDGECIKKQITGELQGDLTYHIEYAGQNELKLLHVSPNEITGYIHNVDEEGKETDLVGIISKSDEISERDREQFEKETRDKGIPEENIVNFTDTDDCPEE